MNDHDLEQDWESFSGRSDAEELALRRERAREETLAYRAITTGDPVFADFAVWHGDRADSTRYAVEIRTLGEQGNWCDCPDFQKNGLGSCKHVLFVLAQPALAEAGERRSPWVEVALVEDVPRVSLPAAAATVVRELVADWADEDGALLPPWEHVLGQFLRAIDAAAPGVRKQFRVSAGVRALAGELGRRQRREAARERTEEILRREGCGRLVGRELSSVQLVGALHLAFAGRAILADEAVHGPRLQALAAAQLLRERGEARRLLVIAGATAQGDWAELAAETLDLAAVELQAALAAESLPVLTVATPEAAAAQAAKVNSLLQPDLIMVDDAGACVPLKSERSRQLKGLRSTNLFALYPAAMTADLDGLYSVVDWVAPTLLGSLFRFNGDFREIGEDGSWGGLRDAAALTERLRPVWLRRGRQIAADERRLPHAGGAAADAFAGQLQMRLGGEVALLRGAVSEDGFLARGLLVVKQVTPRLEAAVADAWRRTHGERQRNLTLLGEGDWQSVQRLQRSGWVAPVGGEGCRDLLGKAHGRELSQAERLRLGREVLSEARRLRKVAQLLGDGGCVVEAAGPAREAALALGRLMAWLHLDGLGAVPATCSAGLVAQLRERDVLSAAALRTLSEARSEAVGGELRAQWLLRQVDELFAEAAPYLGG